MPTSKCVKCDKARQWTNKFGTFDQYDVEFEDGVTGEHSVKENNNPHFTVGQEGDYEITGVSPKGTNKIRKPKEAFGGGGRAEEAFSGKPSGGAAKGGRPAWKERDVFKEEFAKCGGFSRAYCKDLIIAGKLTIEQWDKATSKSAEEMRADVLVARAEWNEQVGGE